MRLGSGWRVALRVGLTAAAVVLMLGPTVAEQRDDSHRLDMEAAGGPVFFRITDLELGPDKVVLTQAQPPVDEPADTAPPPPPEPPPPEPSPAEPSPAEPSPAEPSPAEPVRPRQPTRVPSRVPAELSRRDLLAQFQARRRRPLATVPYMFGDFFGSRGGQTVITLPPISVVVTDGEYDLFVSNAGGTDGANINPAVPITIRNGPGGALVSGSIGNGIDFSGDGQPDTYPISSPNAPGVLPPSVPCPGTLVYTDGSAVFADAQGNAIDGSVGQGNGWSLVANYVCDPNQLVINVPYGGAAVRRFRIAEHSSPQPRCRLFFDFNFFNDVIDGLGDVSQYTFGYERTFGDGIGSIELRVPFAATIDSQQTLGSAEMRDVEIGNLAVWLKAVLYEVPTGLISGGLGAAVPTGASSRVLADQTPILQIENQAVHLLPFLGIVSTPRPRWYWQAFLQLDVDANGNRVRGDVTGQNLNQFGVLQDTTLLFIDAGVGYSIYESAGAGGITRIAPTAELHYTTTLQDPDAAMGNGFLIGSSAGRFDVLNLTLGTSFVLNDRLWVRPAMVVPLRHDDDEHFDYEAMVQIDWQL